MTMFDSITRVSDTLETAHPGHVAGGGLSLSNRRLGSSPGTPLIIGEVSREDGRKHDFRSHPFKSLEGQLR